MVRVVVTEKFTLQRFDELKNITRKNLSKRGMLFVGDTFECTNEMAEYLTKKNPAKRAFVKVIEVLPTRTRKNTKKELTKKEENDINNV